MKKYVRWLQGQLGVAVDGVVGPVTMYGVDSLGLVPLHWGRKRRVVGTVQALLSGRGFPLVVDGWDGPDTRAAYGEATGTGPTDWRTGPGKGWPTTLEKELTQIYGPPGSGQVRLTSPYPLRIAWNTSQVVRSFSIHRLVRDSAANAMEGALEYYGLEEVRRLGLDLFGGCLNVRKVRGANRLSTHSWGIAIDWDPAHNRLRWNSTKARLAKNAYKPWHGFWEENGWVNLGREKDFDWMHFRKA